MGRIVGVIPARFGSSRFPGKPLALIAGKTLIQRTLENSQQFLEEVVVATDDERIADHVQGLGAQAIMTSPSAPTGTDRIAEALPQLPDADIIVNIQGDWPCIAKETIQGVVSVLQRDDEAAIGTAVVPIQSEEQWADPGLVKCVVDQQWRALYFTRAPIPYRKGVTIGQVPVYGHLGIYAYRPAFLRQYQALTPTPLEQVEKLEQLRALEHGFVIGVQLMEEVPMSVDWPEDVVNVEEYLCSLSTCS